MSVTREDMAGCSVHLTGDETAVEILDQRALPNVTDYLRLETAEEFYEAIRTLAVRGAPAIGICAGYAMYVLALRGGAADAPAAQAQVKALQSHISAHFYPCTKEILAGLGRLYAAGGDFTESIDRAGGAGTAAFAAEAIRRFCEE